MHTIGVIKRLLWLKGMLAVTAPVVFIFGLIVISYVPGHYIFLLLLIFVVLAAAPQIITYKHFKDLWLKEAFMHSKEPEELLRMLKNTLLIKESLTIDHFEARYMIDIHISKPTAYSSDLPDEIHIHKKRWVPLAVAILVSFVGIAFFAGALISEEYFLLLLSVVAAITVIVMIRRFRSKYPRVILSEDKIVMNDIALTWDLVERYRLTNQGNTSFELTLLTYLNKQLTVMIDYPNHPYYAVEYFMNKYSGN
jgi:hypothetical protein